MIPRFGRLTLLSPPAPPLVERLGYNDISFDGASGLASLLDAGPGTLQTLELQGNRVGDAGAVALARGLSRSGADGGGGGGGKRGPRQVARTKVERRGPGLRRLNLAGNGVGCIGACALAKAVRGTGGKGALEELELAGNAVSAGCARWVMLGGGTRRACARAYC